MDIAHKPLTLSLLVENLLVNKPIAFLLATMLSSLPLEPSRLDQPIKMLPQLSPKFAKLMELNQFKVFSPIKLRNI
jgi:hypothetical protein